MSDQTALSDTKLLRQLQAGDDASFEVLFLRHYERVYAALFALLGHKTDAEDVAQQAFIKLYHAPERLRLDGDETNVAGWLYRVALHEGYNALRRQKRRAAWQEQFARLWPFSTALADPAQVAESHDIQARVRRILLQLKPRDAKLLLLRYTGLSYAELAAVLEVAPGSIGSLLTRAERVFREKYEAAFPET
ncbi:MAG: sigma-70 family RNA polymerase sigma factor [Anaerolineae bacterium]|nr:sigma-70 family RNA polymerase sigma factor [Anaerolineae bacterium]